MLLSGNVSHAVGGFKHRPFGFTSQGSRRLNFHRLSSVLSFLSSLSFLFGLRAERPIFSRCLLPRKPANSVRSQMERLSVAPRRSLVVDGRTYRSRPGELERGCGGRGGETGGDLARSLSILPTRRDTGLHMHRYLYTYLRN